MKRIITLTMCVLIAIVFAALPVCAENATESAEEETAVTEQEQEENATSDALATSDEQQTEEEAEEQQTETLVPITKEDLQNLITDAVNKAMAAAGVLVEKTDEDSPVRSIYNWMAVNLTWIIPIIAIIAWYVLHGKDKKQNSETKSSIVSFAKGCDSTFSDVKSLVADLKELMERQDREYAMQVAALEADKSSENAEKAEMAKRLEQSNANRVAADKALISMLNVLLQSAKGLTDAQKNAVEAQYRAAMEAGAADDKKE